MSTSDEYPPGWDTLYQLLRVRVPRWPRAVPAACVWTFSPIEGDRRARVAVPVPLTATLARLADALTHRAGTGVFGPGQDFVTRDAAELVVGLRQSGWTLDALRALDTGELRALVNGAAP